MEMYEYLKQQAVAHGPSGHEYETAAWFKSLFEPLCDSVTIDPLFNVIALKKATLPTKDGSPAPRVMLAAHQDEIALMVADILPDGTLRLDQVGGVDPRILPASTVTVHARGSENGYEKLLGVVGAMPPHLLDAEARKNNYKREELFVDLGFGYEDVCKRVHIGDLVTLNGPATKLLNERCAAKSMDDRACIGALIDAAERLQRMNHICDIYFVCTTQEELGFQGCYTATYTIDPDLAIALDVTHATIPSSRPDSTVPLDKPSLSHGPYLQYKLVKRLTDTAKAHGIETYTSKASRNTYTDCDAMQISRAGVPVALIDVPLKYMHTSVEVVDMNVIRESGRLLAHFLSELDEGWDNELWI
ncbi:MAG: M42 family peptidase [Clostridia bacterium]|nr:M42 family peptidase [Clostridia bacterium]